MTVPKLITVANDEHDFEEIVLMTVWHDGVAESAARIWAEEETEVPDQADRRRFNWRMFGAITCAVLAATVAYFLK